MRKQKKTKIRLNYQNTMYEKKKMEKNIKIEIFVWKLIIITKIEAPNDILM